MTSSAYSRSPPTGSPDAKRVTATSGARSCSAAATWRAVASPVVVGFVASTTSTTPSMPAVELRQPEVLGLDAVDRRQRAPEDVVAAAELVGALDRDHVAAASSTTQSVARVAALVEADRAARALGEVEADLAERDLLLDLADRQGEREASSFEVRRTWNARRWAVRLPIPGSFESSVTSRWRGGASN